MVGDVAIDIQGERSCGMTKVSLHRLDIVSGPDRRHSIAVTQIMESGVGATDGRDSFFIVFDQRSICKVLAKFVGKHKVTVTLDRSRPQTHFSLSSPVMMKKIHDPGGHTNRPLFVILCGDQFVLSLTALYLLQLPVNQKLVPLEIHPAPS